MRVVLVVDPPTVLRWRRAGKHRTATLGQLFAGTKVTTAYPDEYLESLAEPLPVRDVVGGITGLN